MNQMIFVKTGFATVETCGDALGKRLDNPESLLKSALTHIRLRISKLDRFQFYENKKIFPIDDICEWNFKSQYSTLPRDVQVLIAASPANPMVKWQWNVK